MAIVRTDDNHYGKIAETIRTWTQTEETYKPEDMWIGVESVFWTGHTAGQAEGGGGEDYLRLVGNPKFPGLGVFDKEEVELTFDIADGADRMIYAESYQTPYPNTTVKHLTVNFVQKVKYTRQAFMSSPADTVLEHITFNADMSKSTTCLQMFYNLPALKVIDGTPLDLSASTNNSNMINNSINVEEMRFVPLSVKGSIGLQGSGKLSAATRQSIAYGLADLTGQTAQTVTVHPDVYAKMVEEGLDVIITAKNWVIAS